MDHIPFLHSTTGALAARMKCADAALPGALVQSHHRAAIAAFDPLTHEELA